MPVAEHAVAVASPAPPLDAEALWLEFRGQLRAFVARRISDGADVDDIVQWVFLRLLESQSTVRKAERVHAWLYRTARRAIADYYRVKGRKREVPSGATADLEVLARRPSAGTPANDDSAFREAASCLAPLVERLPPAYRQAIALADLRGVRLADVAKSARVSLSGMKSRVQRGRKRLERLLLDCCRIAVTSGRGVTSCESRVANPGCGCRADA